MQLSRHKHSTFLDGHATFILSLYDVLCPKMIMMKTEYKFDYEIVPRKMLGMFDSRLFEILPLGSRLFS